MIDNFKEESKGAILVATQVAEMSLDLSADLLVTDIAPIPSLIQRLGRLNRRSTPERPLSPKPAFVCPLPEGEPNASLPYDKEDLMTALQWIASRNRLTNAQPTRFDGRLCQIQRSRRLRPGGCGATGSLLLWSMEDENWCDTR